MIDWGKVEFSERFDETREVYQLRAGLRLYAGREVSRLEILHARIIPEFTNKLLVKAIRSEVYGEILQGLHRLCDIIAVLGAGQFFPPDDPRNLAMQEVNRLLELLKVPDVAAWKPGANTPMK